MSALERANNSKSRMRSFIVLLLSILIFLKAAPDCVAFTANLVNTPSTHHHHHISFTRCWSTSNNDNSNDELIVSQQRRNLLGIGFAAILMGGQARDNVAWAINVPDLPSFPEFPSLRGDSSNNNNNKNNNNNNRNGFNKRIGGLAAKIRAISRTMDELQRDLMQERWDLVANYPAQLRSYVPVFTTYTDSAFPTDAPTDKGLRVALRYEVGRFFASLERLKQAAGRRALDEAYVAYADMSLHFDRYLHVGGLYTYYDDLISTEPYFKGFKDNDLVYSDPVKDPAEVRDLIVLCKGPDKGKTGIVVGIYQDGRNYCVVKLDRIKGMREIKVVPRTWAAKRLGEQDPDDVFLIPRKGI